MGSLAAADFSSFQFGLKHSRLAAAVAVLIWQASWCGHLVPNALLSRSNHVDVGLQLILILGICRRVSHGRRLTHDGCLAREANARCWHSCKAADCVHLNVRTAGWDVKLRLIRKTETISSCFSWDEPPQRAHNLTGKMGIPLLTSACGQDL